MKEELRQCVNALHIIEQMPQGEIKDREIRNFVESICGRHGQILPNLGKIRYYEFDCSRPREDIYVSVVIIQTDVGDSIIVYADFGDED